MYTLHANLLDSLSIAKPTIHMHFPILSHFDIVDKLVCDGYGFTVKLNFKLKTIQPKIAILRGQQN